MDRTFYAILFVVLFGIVAAILSIRFLLGQRIDRYERKRRMEEETRQISENNSGL